MISTWKAEKLGKIAINLITIFFKGYLGLAKYHTVWATFSRHLVLDVLSLACAIRIISYYVSIKQPSLQYVFVNATSTEC